jgi:hypothetical protein
MKRLLFATSLLALLPAVAFAQDSQFRGGAKTGSNEITLSGTGSSNNDFDAGSFGVSGSYGYFMTNSFELGARQSINWAGANNADDSWSGSTRIFADYHFLSTQRFRPFVGASIGYTYGDGVSDTGTIGPELGIKYYVNDTTFIIGMAEYQWFFDSGDDVSDNFDNGAFLYTVGLGFVF